MNVLSLFDGISCGRLALDRAGVSYDAYYASEINTRALAVSRHNYPDTIHLGDVRTVDVFDLPPITLLIGGSPCQGFSSIGYKHAFADPRSRLFFEFVRVLYESQPRYFLLENVRMSAQHRDVISYWLQCDPVLIDSRHFSAQTRARLYWTNIPVLPYTDRRIYIDDILDPVVSPGCDVTDRCEATKGIRARKYIHDHTRQLKSRHKVRCLTAAGQRISNVGATLVEAGGRIYQLSAEECERAQTVPVGYTDVGLSCNQRRSLLGNGWTVDVIAHIFQGLHGNL